MTEFNPLKLSISIRISEFPDDKDKEIEVVLIYDGKEISKDSASL